MFYRHNRVWLSEEGWQCAGAYVPEAHTEALQQWIDNGWPATVRRAETDHAIDRVYLGITLPPYLHQGKKIRVPFSACVDDVVRHEAPLDITAAVPALHPAWQAPFDALSRSARTKQLKFHVYGAVAMQAETRLAYLNSSSDIDLLFYPMTEEQLQEGLALLMEYAKLLPLDGEIIFPSGRAVAWKEWAYASEKPESMRVLTKSMRGVHLTHVAHLLTELNEPPWSR